MTNQRITLHTKDAVTIIGTWVMPTTPTKGVVLALHMLPADRTSWSECQSIWAEQGIASLAIDLRGHGESLVSSQGALDYRNFTVEQHQSSLNDVQAALEWLKQTCPDQPIALIGSSIGANLGLQALSQDESIRGMIALSPGHAYHGVATDKAIKHIHPKQAVWLLASRGDDDESAEAVDWMKGHISTSQVTVTLLENAGHGNKLFASHPDLLSQTASWFAHLFTSIL